MLSYIQEKKIKDLLAYYKYNVSAYCRSNPARDFTNIEELQDWFNQLPVYNNFYTDELAIAIIKRGITNQHDLLLLLAKTIGLKRKNTVTDARRKKLHEQLNILRNKC